MRFLLLFSASLLATTSAYFSVVGLSKIFTGILLPFIILEGAKFVAAIYLHSYWGTITKAIKVYLLIAVSVLMVMTSSGIYGYLSAAAIGHTTSTKNKSASVSAIEGEIKQLESRKSDLVSERSRLDRFVDKQDNVAIYTKQKSQRKSIDDELVKINKEMTSLNKNRIDSDASLNEVRGEVGAALYLAKSIYGNDSIESIESAIRIVIYLIVFTFDPLAVVLLIAAQDLFSRKLKPQPTSTKEDVNTSIEADSVVNMSKVSRVYDIKIGNLGG